MCLSRRRALAERVSYMCGLGHSLILKTKLNCAIILLCACSPQSMANVLHPTVALQSLRVRFPDACFVLSSPNAQVFGGLDHGVGHCRPLSINLLYALLAIPLVYCHINNFQRASRLVRPFQEGEKMTAMWASHHEELCSDGVVAPPACVHMVVPHR